jgi:rhodanese-related sulfurtransferase/DNA-binding transcriptional ArsR family regulator
LNPLEESAVVETGREYKTAVYEQFALIGKALCSAPRLEILDVLQQAERTVEVLAAQVGLSVANTSHHLQVLKRGRLVASERRGQHVVYRLADPAVAVALRAVRLLGERRLSEIERVTDEFLGDREGMEVVDEDALVARVARGDCIVLDVRPSEEYEAGHLARAISMPLEDLERRLAELPRDVPIVAYCRGPYCVLAVSAVETLRRHGFDAVRAREGVREWRELGLSVTAPEQEMTDDDG